MIRYYWTIIVVVALFLFIGAPVVFVGHILLAVFGVKEFIFPYARFGCRIWLWSAGARGVTGQAIMVAGGEVMN
jgi:hypothetical protein